MRRIPKFQFILGCLIAMMLTGCREQIVYSGLGQREANEMLAVLEAAGYAAKTSSEGRVNTFTVSVPQGQLGAASRVLARAGLPREKQAALTDILPKDAYLMSPADDRARLAYGLSQELTGTLMQVAGVALARVHIALPEKNALGQMTAPPSASVLIRHNPDVLGPDFQDQVRSLVANSLAGLSFDRVAVTMIPDAITPQLQRRDDAAAPAPAVASAPETVLTGRDTAVGSKFMTWVSSLPPLVLMAALGLLLATAGAGLVRGRK